MMEYKGYIAKVEFDDEARTFHGEIINMRDVVTFEADCVNDLEREFYISVDDYLEYCEELGREPSKPFSGKFVLRVSSELHKEIYIKSQLADKSLNTWITEVLEQAVTEKQQRVPIQHSS